MHGRVFFGMSQFPLIRPGIRHFPLVQQGVTSMAQFPQLWPTLPWHCWVPLCSSNYLGLGLDGRLVPGTKCRPELYCLVGCSKIPYFWFLILFDALNQYETSWVKPTNIGTHHFSCYFLKIIKICIQRSLNLSKCEENSTFEAFQDTVYIWLPPRWQHYCTTFCLC